MAIPKNLPHPDGAYFDQAKVDEVIGFIESLTLTKSTRSDEPEPFIVLPHWRDMIEHLYGWRRADGRRQYRKAFATCGRKQTKTQICAGLTAYEFFMGDTSRHEIYFAATDRDQAGIGFRAVDDMILAAPELLQECKRTASEKKIEHLGNGNLLKALSADGAGKHGYNPSVVVFDELHMWSNPHMELYRALTTGGKSRRDPLRLMVTTAGHDMESLWGQEYAYAKAILAGEIKDTSYLPVIYEVPKEADWTDRTLWPMALPLLDTGHHRYEDYEEEFVKTERSAHEQSTFRRLYLNQPMGAETQWLDMVTWDACEGPAPSEDILRSCPCWAGLDLGAVRDLTALALIWALPDGTAFTRVWGYLPKDDIQVREKRDAVPYGSWCDAGWIKQTPGNVTDWRRVTDDIKALAQTYQIQAVAYDAWGARDTVAALAESGIEVIEFGQAFKHMHPAVSRVEELVFSRRLLHEASPVLRWCVDNSMVKADDNGHKKLVKPQRLTNSKRIDLAMALTMATGVMTINESYSDPYSDGRAKLN